MYSVTNLGANFILREASRFSLPSFNVHFNVGILYIYIYMYVLITFITVHILGT